MKKMKSEIQKLTKLLKESSKALSQIEGQSEKVKEFYEVIKKIKALEAIDSSAKLEGCQNIDLLYDCISDGIDFEDFDIDADFSDIGSELVKKAKFDKDTSLLFFNQTSHTSPRNKPKGRNPFSKKHFNLTEQGRIVKGNPDLARQLKAEAEEIDAC